MSRDEAVATMARELHDGPGGCAAWRCTDPAGHATAGVYVAQAERSVEAVWPVIERAVRAQAAAEVRAIRVGGGHDGSCCCAPCTVRRSAARIVEGP